MRSSLHALVLGGLCAIGIAGCGGVKPDMLARADILAVTLPETLLAGQTVLVTVHWRQQSCNESFLAFNSLDDGNGNLRLEVMTRIQRPADPCPDYYDPYATTNSVAILVPRSGARKLIVVGRRHSIVLTLEASLPLAGAHHAVELVRRDDGTPASDVPISYVREGYPPDTLATARTDAAGMASSTLACALGQAVILQMGEPSAVFPFPEALRFGEEHSLCGRALRTLALFGPEADSRDPQVRTQATR